MPSVKRWFPVSREINDDPELWTFTDEFGDRSLRTWLEILSILDRNENRWRVSGQWLASLSRKVRQTPASIRREVDWLLANGWLEVGETLADGSPAVLRASNYWKYRNTQEQKGKNKHSRTGKDNLPSHPPTLPTHPMKREKEEEITPPPPSLALVPTVKDDAHATETWVVETWNRIPGIKRLKLDALKIPHGVRDRMRVRLTEHPTREWWETLFELVRTSDFLTGKTEKPFQATLDWVLGPKNLAKVLQGNYENTKAHGSFAELMEKMAGPEGDAPCWPSATS